MRLTESLAVRYFYFELHYCPKEVGSRRIIGGDSSDWSELFGDICDLEFFICNRQPLGIDGLKIDALSTKYIWKIEAVPLDGPMGRNRSSSKIMRMARDMILDSRTAFVMRIVN